MLKRITKSLAYMLLFAVLVGCGTSKKARTRASKINAVIKSARSYTGVPYKWGGTTRGGMDCSGLLLNSYKVINMKIPRTSAEQSEFGKKVKKKKIMAGDWVFFATGKKRRKITHVGLVTSIGGSSVKFIHASTSVGVVESNLNSEYYRKRYRMARRPF